jgi:transketolase
MRNTFIDELVLQATSNERIALIVGDLGYSVVEPFAEKFPKRFINAGVAEQNMMGMAAGMASEGYHVFVYSIANFPTFRCAEQIRNDVAYHNLPVTVVAVGGGLAYGNLGYSHHAIQDYGLLRMMPNMLIAAPGDIMEVRGCLRYLITNPQPSYLRLGKNGEAACHSDVPLITPGDWVQVRAGAITDEVMLTTGSVLGRLLSSSVDLKQRSVYSIPIWGMNLKNNQNFYLDKYKKIITYEDHLLDCGFGSWLLESQQSRTNCEIKINAIDSIVCGMVGSQNWLEERSGLVWNRV